MASPPSPFLVIRPIVVLVAMTPVPPISCPDPAEVSLLESKCWHTIGVVAQIEREIDESFGLCQSPLVIVDAQRSQGQKFSCHQ